MQNRSTLSDAERFDAWRRSRGGDLSVVIGARSAVFSPLENLDLVVVDEEHESSYKQNEAPCYNARDAAVMLAAIYDCPVLLGSATPSVESYANAISGKYGYLSLPTRVARSRRFFLLTGKVLPSRKGRYRALPLTDPSVRV